jgi:hypothetical protein
VVTVRSEQEPQAARLGDQREASGVRFSPPPASHRDPLSRGLSYYLSGRTSGRCPQQHPPPAALFLLSGATGIIFANGREASEAELAVKHGQAMLLAQASDGAAAFAVSGWVPADVARAAQPNPQGKGPTRSGGRTARPGPPGSTGHPTPENARGPPPPQPVVPSDRAGATGGA